MTSPVANGGVYNVVHFLKPWYQTTPFPARDSWAGHWWELDKRAEHTVVTAHWIGGSPGAGLCGKAELVDVVVVSCGDEGNDALL